MEEEKEGEKIVRIKVKLKTREKLIKMGKKGESYDDVITWMLGDLDPREEAPDI
ncbi:hypothetical protein [ANMV-1 virus]|nr:hypothetical protein [ANMV-1 virus]